MRVEINRDPVAVPAEEMREFLISIVDQFPTKQKCAEYFGVALTSVFHFVRKCDWTETHLSRALRRSNSAFRTVMLQLASEYGSELDALMRRQVEPDWRAYLAFDEYSAPYGTEEDVVIAYRQRAGVRATKDNGAWSPERLRREADEVGLDGELLEQRVLDRLRIDRRDAEGDRRQWSSYAEFYGLAPGVAV